MSRLAIAVAFCSVFANAEISERLFRHHAITRELPGKNVGIGASALADFDKDGDLDLALYNRGDGNLYWFEQRGKEDWVRHLAAEFPMSQLGAASFDVDRDGWPDIIVGGYWYRNSGKPRTEGFQRFTYDNTIRSEIHDVVVVDIDSDGKSEIAVLGDGSGCFWYKVPEDPRSDTNWPRETITLAVRNDKDDIHSGIFPAGMGDLDGDGDPDAVITDRWLENRDGGKQWIEHRITHGRKGPWGLSSRSAVIDLDKDGDNDIVMVDSDGQNSGAAWLENNGKTPPGFTAHYLANRAPGTRGSFHSLRLADFDGDGDTDLLVIEQEDPSILPQGATPRWFIFENVTSGRDVRFEERVILDARLGGHDAFAADIDGDGDIDVVSKIWRVWSGNANGGRVHVDWLENRTR